MVTWTVAAKSEGEAATSPGENQAGCEGRGAAAAPAALPAQPGAPLVQRLQQPTLLPSLYPFLPPGPQFPAQEPSAAARFNSLDVASHPLPMWTPAVLGAGSRG